MGVGFEKIKENFTYIQTLIQLGNRETLSSTGLKQSLV